MKAEYDSYQTGWLVVLSQSFLLKLNLKPRLLFDVVVVVLRQKQPVVSTPYLY